MYRGSSPRPIIKYLSNFGVNWIKIGDTKNSDNYQINDVEEKITIEGAKKSRKVNKGEIILANSMSFGKAYLLNIDGYIYDGWFVLRDYEKYFDKIFLLQLLNSDYMQRQYKKLSAGGIVQNISSDIVYNTKIICPPLTEQKKIATFLSKIDERISTQRALIEDLEMYKKGLMQKLFSREIRFPNFSDEWEEKTLGEVCEKKSSNISANSLEENDGIYKIYGATGVLKSIDFYTEENGYIAIVKDGAGAGRLFLCEEKTSILGTLDIIQSKNIDLKFLYYFFNTLDFSKYITGSTIPHIYFKDYKNEKIKVPHLEEQQKIAQIFSALDQKLDLENQLLEQYQQQKKYLLQKMFV